MSRELFNLICAQSWLLLACVFGVTAFVAARKRCEEAMTAAIVVAIVFFFFWLFAMFGAFTEWQQVFPSSAQPTAPTKETPDA